MKGDREENPYFTLSPYPFSTLTFVGVVFILKLIWPQDVRTKRQRYGVQLA
jgi:hypothetical protein